MPPGAAHKPGARSPASEVGPLSLQLRVRACQQLPLEGDLPAMAQQALLLLGGVRLGGLRAQEQDGSAQHFHLTRRASELGMIPVESGRQPQARGVADLIRGGAVAGSSLGRPVRERGTYVMRLQTRGPWWRGRRQYHDRLEDLGQVVDGDHEALQGQALVVSWSASWRIGAT